MMVKEIRWPHYVRQFLPRTRLDPFSFLPFALHHLFRPAKTKCKCADPERRGETRYPSRRFVSRLPTPRAIVGLYTFLSCRQNRRYILTSRPHVKSSGRSAFHASPLSREHGRAIRRNVTPHRTQRRTSEGRRCRRRHWEGRHLHHLAVGTAVACRAFSSELTAAGSRIDIYAKSDRNDGAQPGWKPPFVRNRDKARDSVERWSPPPADFEILVLALCSLGSAIKEPQQPRFIAHRKGQR